MNELKTDICVIGAGAGGLSVAAGASQMGASVVLIEKDKMGGDCLNTGCVPSKSLLAAARAVESTIDAKNLGITAENLSINFDLVHQHLQHVIKKISPKDSIERFEKLGVHVIQGIARFVNKKTIEINDSLVTAKYFVIATGSKAAAPKIDGLDKINYLTNDSIFNLTENPEHLVIIGGGPIGCEMAQAFRLLGSKVTLIQRSRILSKDDPELTSFVQQQLIKMGVEIIENINIISIEKKGAQIIVYLDRVGEKISVTGSHLLIAAGRKPDINDLNLEAAKVDVNKRGIVVNKKLQSSNRKIYAVGDVAGSYQFTHIANYQAGIVLRNILFHWPFKINYQAISWVTYTNPELAHVGLHENEAKETYKKVQILTLDFKENDRAQTENKTLGMIKIVTTKNGKILGASIVGHNAGELISLWSLAISQNLKIKTIAGLIIPYPTLSEISKQAAVTFYTPLLFSNRMKKIVRFLMRVFG